MTEQLHQGSSFGLPTPSEVDLAELQVERIPSVERIRFINSGTKAVMMAVQAARAYTGRASILKCEGCYHSNYDFAAVSTSFCGNVKSDSPPVSLAHAAGIPHAVLDDVVVIRYNDLDGLEQAITAHKPRLATVLLDLMPWRLGLIAADDAFVRAARDLARAHGIVLICDEIITLGVVSPSVLSVNALTS